MKPDRDKTGSSSFAEGALSVLAVLEHDSRPVEAIYLLPRAKTDEKNILRLLTLAKKKKVPVRMADEAYFDSVVTGHTHGGVIAAIGERRMLSPAEVFDRANGFAFLLCGVEDPFNFGCAVRSFWAAGAGGMILSPRNWLSAAGVVLRSSAGATEAIACGVYSDEEALCDLAKEKGYRIVCAAEKNAVELYEADLSKPVFLIVGGEKRGISRVFLDRADLSVRIPYGRRFRGSLTTSAAAAVCAFEVLRHEKTK